ncbi:protein of unknown function (DUF2341), partial [Candidatus Methanophagaceae archaeon]
MRREKSKWKIACILFVALLITSLIAFGATQNETLQNVTLPENIITSEHVAELNETPSEDNTDGTAPIQAIQTPENVTDNDTTDNAPGITIQTPEYATDNNTTANATGVTLQSPENATDSNTTGNATGVTLQTPENATDNNTIANATCISIQSPENATDSNTTGNATGVTLQAPENATDNNTTANATGISIQAPENATDNTSVIGLNYTINESAGESRNNNVTESVIGTPKLIANKESYSLDEEPTFSFEYKTFRKSFIKNASQKTFKNATENASQKTFKNVTENASREMLSSLSEEAAEAATGAPQKALKKWVTENETIETCVYDSSGDLTDLAPEIAKTGEGKFAIELPKARAFRAGIYKLSVRLVKDEHVYVLESEFPWGLVSVNTRKSIYKPGETAELVIVVLDKAGHSVKNADIYLTVNNPNNEETTYSTADGTITASSESGIYNLDYHTEIEGNHTVFVTALIDNVEVSFNTYFRVQPAYEFELVRTAQSKIDPTKQDRFVVRIDVESLTDAESVTVKEFVPAEFEVYSTDAATVMQEGDTKTITWNKDLIDKKTSVCYSYAVPPVWPYLYALGPAEISHGTETFLEARPWYIAVDPISIINVQSYPSVGGNWSVKFETEGTADLTITAVNGTTWTNQPYECYDEETELLTKEGWKLFKDLEPEEAVLTLNPETNAQEWQKPIKYLEYDYSDAMFEITLADGTQLLVSPEHKVYGAINSNFMRSLFNSNTLNGLPLLISAENLNNFSMPVTMNEKETVTDTINPNGLNTYSLLKISDLIELSDNQLVFLDSEQNPVAVTKIEEIPYTGKIYSVTVPNRILLVRRKNTTAIWCGNSNYDLQLLELKCGNRTLDYEWVNDSVFIENCECTETGYEISKVLTAGSHHLKIQFGSDVEYAHNWATDLSNWSYRQNYSISNTGENLSYYQVKIELNASNVGSNWNWSNNGDDTRFTYYNSSTETETEIPFWIESWNSTANTSKIWVNVTSVANNTDTKIYMYYGNSNASSASNGTNTFEFFDDFESYSIGTIGGQGGWSILRTGGNGYARVQTKNGRKHLVTTSTDCGTHIAKALTSTDNHLILETYAYAENCYESYFADFGGGTCDSIGLLSAGYELIWFGWGNTLSKIRECPPGTDLASIYESGTVNQYYKSSFVWDGSNLRAYRDDVLKLSGTDSTPYSSLSHIHLGSWSGAIWDTDWVFVRKYASPEPSVSLGGTVISSHTPSKQLQIQDERGASYKQSYPYLQKSRTLNASATLSLTDGVGGVRFIVDQGEVGETIVNDTNTSDTLFCAQFSGLSYGNHTLDITILNTSQNPLSGAGQTESIDPFWIVPHIIQFIGDSITISREDTTNGDVYNITDAQNDGNAATNDNLLELPCWDNDAVTQYQDYNNGIHIFYSNYAKSIYGTYVFGNNEAQSGITAEETHTKFIANNNGYADRFTSLDENNSNANLFGPTHAYVMLGLNDKCVGDSESKYETQLSNVVNDTHDQGIPYENIILLYPTYWQTHDVSNYLDNIDNVANNLGTRLITDLYNETKDNYNSGGSWYCTTDNVHFNRAGSRNISRIIAEQSTWLATGQAIYTEFSGSETTDFNNLPDITNVSDATLNIANTAKIAWYGNVNASGANFDTNVDFGFAFVDVNASGLNNTFNSSANVTLYNLSWSETPVIFEDGSLCPDCTINFYSGGNLSFNVTHFTNYSVGANANLTIWDDTDTEGGGQTKYPGNQIKFYANYTNKTSGQSINGTGISCNISFDVTPNGPFGMTFNSSSLLYEYNRSFSSSGTFNWNVTGNGSVQDYEELNITDTVTVSTSNNPPAITLNKPDNGSTTSNNWAILNATVTDADNDNTTVYFYANNNSNGLNDSEGLVYIGENVANGTTLTYNLTALPIKPSEDELVLLMHFDNRSEFGEDLTHVYDFSGNTNNGTVNGNPNYNISGGKFAGAFEFDGTGDYINAGDVMPAGAYTKVAWVKRGTGTFNNNIISGDNNHAFWAPSVYSFHLSAGHNAVWNIVEDSVALDVGKWYQVAVTFDPNVNSGQMVLYKNGVQADNATSVATQADSSITYIGRFESGNNWKGTIDEAAIYNRALSSAEIKAHYALGEGKYYWKVNATDGLISNESSIWDFTLEFVGDTYIPPDPINLANTTGNFWVNHTWSAGSGNVTNSYNVSVNSVWHNTTTNTFWNATYTTHAWQNITVYAWNSSSTGTLSAGNVTQDTQIPNNPITITNTSGWSGDAGANVYVDYDATDADSDTPTFSCNRTDLFTDFDTANGTGNWTAVVGTYYVDFGVSDGYGSTDNYTMTITVGTPGYIPPDPINLANTTGNFWVNHTWSAGSGNVTNSYNVSINSVWHNTTTDTFWNDTYTAYAWQNITVYAYNTSGTGTLSTGNVTQNTQAPSIDWTDWDCHRAVIINNTGGSELNYYQLNVSLGDGINETSLRVVNVTVNTTIPHWCGTVVGGNCTKLWFNATHIPANSWCNDTYR